MTNVTHSQKYAQVSDYPDWLKVEEIQVVLRLGRSTVYEKIRSGEIPSRRFGNSIRVHKSFLDLATKVSER